MRGLRRVKNYLAALGLIPDPRWAERPAHGYLEDHHPDREWFVSFMLLRRLSSILEVGAGSCHELRMLAARGGLAATNYTVVDGASQFLRAGKKEFPQVQFRKANIRRLPFSDGAFDVSYVKSVIEHQRHYERPVSELIRVSRRLIIINMFQWAKPGEGDIITRKKYYQNSYALVPLIDFMRKRLHAVLSFLILKGDAIGENYSDDPRGVRTGDHLVILGMKEDVPELSRLALDAVAQRGLRVVHPYP
ncbi:MAG: class I SAM-dependent methyltransferase [Candidatus Tectomicrobia bacterium]|nr:class I SAM-dependent methyltransferase [Candidatus Tectomicrobia bacterium]